MTRLLTLTSALALILTAGISFATQESTWGQIKHQQTQPAAKRIKTNGQDADGTNTVNATYTTASVTDAAPADGRTVTATFGPAGGSFFVKDTQGPGKKDDLEVIFTIPAGVLDTDVTISMTVTGTDFDTLDIAFTPAGFVFNIPVDLRIDLGDDLTSNKAIAKMEPYHLYSDGTTETVDVYHIDRSSNAFNIFMKVPGFSRYGLRGGW